MGKAGSLELVVVLMLSGVLHVARSGRIMGGEGDATGDVEKGEEGCEEVRNDKKHRCR